METKKVTLRSQTVKCPHCGEYYSVTYKYCPFCDAGRQEEEHRLAEKKKKKQAFFANLFGSGHEEEKADKQAETHAESKAPQKKHAEQPAEEPAQDIIDEGPELLIGTPVLREAPKPRKHSRKTAQTAQTAQTTAKSGKSRKAAAEPELTEQTRHRRRKKTSEMTEEEKAVDRAEREARAAARKRERERKAALAAEAARQAEEAKKAAQAKQAEEAAAQPETEPAETQLPAETAPAEPTAQESAAPETAPQAAEPAKPVPPTFIEEMPTQMPLVGSGPVFDEVMVPDSFGFEETIVSTDLSILNEPTVPAAPVESAAEAHASADAEESAAPVGTESPEEAPVLDETPAVSEAPAETQPAAAAPEEAQAAPAEEPAAQTAPDAPAAETPVETEEDLDALLSEIRDLLVSSPVPSLAPGELEKPEVPAEPEPEVQLAGEQMTTPEYLPEEDEAAPAAEEEAPAETVPAPDAEVPAAPVVNEPAADELTADELAVDEPTVAMGKLELSDPLAEPVDELLYDDQPTQVISTQEIVEKLEAKADAAVEGAELDSVIPVAALSSRRTAAAPETKARKSKQRTKAAKPAKASKPVKTEKAPKPVKAKTGKKNKKAKKQRSATLPLIVVSLVIIIAALLIVFSKVVPTLQNGIFAGQEQTTPAESLTLDQTELNLAEAGITVTLVPAFSPEGSAGTVTWITSDEKIAAVDEAGTVTAVAPGTATITAALDNGAKAECKVSCAWNAESGEKPAAENTSGGEADAQPPQQDAKPTLSNNDITLSGEGDTQQLTVENAGGDVTWSSSDNAIAKVGEDGTVTAVAPGRATVTGKVGEQTFNCAVRCVW